MALRDSDAILFHPRDFGPGGSHGAEGRIGATSQADEVQGWRGMGGGECIQLASDSGAFEQRPGMFGGGELEVTSCNLIYQKNKFKLKAKVIISKKINTLNYSNKCQNT